jgi:hypothetical protein
MCVFVCSSEVAESFGRAVDQFKKHDEKYERTKEQTKYTDAL